MKKEDETERCRERPSILVGKATGEARSSPGRVEPVESVKVSIILPGVSSDGRCVTYLPSPKVSSFPSNPPPRSRPPPAICRFVLDFRPFSSLYSSLASSLPRGAGDDDPHRDGVTVPDALSERDPIIS